MVDLKFEFNPFCSYLVLCVENPFKMQFSFLLNKWVTATCFKSFLIQELIFLNVLGSFIQFLICNLSWNINKKNYLWFKIRKAKFIFKLFFYLSNNCHTSWHMLSDNFSRIYENCIQYPGFCGTEGLYYVFCFWGALYDNSSTSKKSKYSTNIEWRADWLEFSVLYW